MTDPVTPVASTLPVVGAPAAPSKTGATSSSITISWATVTGAAKYQVRYRTGTNDWNTVDVATATQYTADMLDASTTYRFEVGAYGNGSTHRADWGAWSAHLDAASNAAPTVSGCTTTLGSIAGASTLQGAWTDECVSSNRPATRYARYFTFELATPAELTIELVSSTDPYLFLMSGAGTSGTELARNDDSRDSDLGRLNSRIVYEADAGTYTAEATTYRSTRTADFTISINARLKKPIDVRVIPGIDKLVVLWDPPETVPAGAVYQVQITEAAGSRSRRAILNDPINVGSGTGYEATSLDPAKRYEVRVRTKVGALSSLWTSSVIEGPAALGISLSHVGTNPLEVGQKTNIGVTTTNTINGVDYFVRYEVDAPENLRFGSCSDNFGFTRVPGLERRDMIHGCMVGNADITAKLQVGNDRSGYFDLATSVPVQITVSAGAAQLGMTGLIGSPIFDIGHEVSVSVSASDLHPSTPYFIEITSTDHEGVGFDEFCGTRNRIFSSATTGSATTAVHTFNVHACGSVAYSQITADLKIDGAVVKSVSASPRVYDLRFLRP